MAGIQQLEPLITTDELKTSRLIENIDQNKAKYLFYDNVSDILTLLIDPPSKSVITVVHYIDQHVGLIYDLDSMEVVGFQVDAFEHSFMPLNEDLAAIWRLSDTDVELENLEDFIIVFERIKETVAKKLDTYAQQRLGPRYRSRVPA